MDLLNIKGSPALYKYNFLNWFLEHLGFSLTETEEFRIQAVAAASVELSC